MATLPDDVLLSFGLHLSPSSLLAFSSTCKHLRSLLYQNKGLGVQWLSFHASELEAVVRIRGKIGRWDSVDFGTLEDGRAFVRHEVRTNC